MTYVHQHAWGGIIAAYLFLGGLGGAVTAIAALHDLFFRKDTETVDRRPTVFGVISGLAALGVGTVLLLVDLLQPLKAILGVMNFSSWITWGILFITFYMLFTVLYLAPYLNILTSVLGKYQKVTGTAAAVFGALVALYTGFLVSSSPGIPFWNTPALPLLFLVSAFSTGVALMMVYLALGKSRSDYGSNLLHLLERLDLGLIMLELVILGAYANYARFGAEAAQMSMQFLLSSAGFTIGFLLLGLLLPLALEVWGVGSRQHVSTSVVAVASLLVLLGGALLRFYILESGIYAFPWPS